MIYCVWYPSGGFGHFINAVLSLYGNNFVRPSNHVEFSANGNSHNLKLVVPKYKDDCWEGFQFDPMVNYSVLIDNGIANETTNFLKVFPASNTIKICYTDYSWPIVARTMIEKSIPSTLEAQLPSWDNTNWAVREKYFLYLRDHELRSKWKPNYNTYNIFIDDLLNYQNFYNKLSNFGIADFNTLWQQWFFANSKYIEPIILAKKIISAVHTRENIDLTGYQDLWTQAVVYYFIWLEFEFEVPHNDYANWFTNTNDIVIMLDLA